MGKPCHRRRLKPSSRILKLNPGTTLVPDIEFEKGEERVQAFVYGRGDRPVMLVIEPSGWRIIEGFSDLMDWVRNTFELLARDRIPCSISTYIELLLLAIFDDETKKEG